MSVAPSRSSVADEARRRAQPPPPPAATTGTPVTGSANQNGDGIALRGLPAGLTTNVRQPADRLTGRAVEDTSPTTGTGTSAEQAARAEKVAAAAATVDDRGRAGQALLGTAPARAAAPPLPPAAATVSARSAIAAPAPLGPVGELEPMAAIVVANPDGFPATANLHEALRRELPPNTRLVVLQSAFTTGSEPSGAIAFESTIESPWARDFVPVFVRTR